MMPTASYCKVTYHGVIIAEKTQKGPIIRQKLRGIDELLRKLFSHMGNVGQDFGGNGEAP